MSLDDFKALKTTFNFKKNQNMLPLLSLYEQEKIMSSILQEKDFQNRGKNIESFNEKCTCIKNKCIEYFS